ncbi:DNA-directed RNA polymerase subunit beta [Subdoligranulum sp. DSM 109015]|uniref:DNA-directed RNA polymerase subunit beta n=1 Tax=Gemmiger gallinarum TaxID=2779354 RepID=A0ABR9R1C8_9FIRM|nr:DNA-directed RNA polymerase subunit beta [Gemmiger gallinarum]MBE5036956.1 DNA-directed RNA polymerase subunit beta [Gemmiger gallinarum]
MVKVKPVQNGRTTRMSFSRINEVIGMPNLIEIQKNSYNWFLAEGLREVFHDISAIEDYTGNLVLEFIDFRLDKHPKYTIKECKERDATYAAPLYVTARLFNKQTGEVKEQEIFMGDFPLMTDSGTFISNGAERVIVSQLVRSPGVYYSSSKDRTGKDLFTATMNPNRGAWLEYETDSSDVFYVRIDKNRKLPVTVLLRALGLGTDEQIRQFFGDSEPKINATLEKDTTHSTEEGLLEVYRKLRPGEPPTVESSRSHIDALFFDPRRYDLARFGRYKMNNKLSLARRIMGLLAGEDVIAPLTGELLAAKGEKITREKAEAIDAAGVTRMTVLIERKAEEPLPFIVISNGCVDAQPFFSFDVEAEAGINERASLAGIREILDATSDPEEQKELLRKNHDKLISRTVTVDDIFASINYLLGLDHGIGTTDEIDHLGNRRVRSVGELLQNQFRIGFSRMERVIRERMTLQNQESGEITPQSLVNIRPVVAAIKEFIGSSPLSQFMDQNNPLAELTHKRRLSALGPGGLSRDRAGFEVRDVHYTHYGRLCPIETPEGPNIGLISYLATFAKINKYGFVEAPYRKVDKGTGHVTDEVVYMTADVEDEYIVAQANEPLDENGYFVRPRVSGRHRNDIQEFARERVDFMDVSPRMMVSVATAMIPFLENDDCNRALMGSNMQRQAVPLMVTQQPIVATGMEYKAATDSGVCILAQRAGTVEYVDAEKVVIRCEDGSADTYELIKFMRSNQGTCNNQRPIVSVGEQVKVGDVLADGPATKNGEISLGKNALVGFMTWEGYNYEDAVLLNEKLVREDVYTSIHIEEYETEARETKLGPEEITRDIPNVGDEALKDLDDRGIIRVGAEVNAGDILVGKVTPKGETELTAEERLLRAIFGEKAREVRDTSLRVPHGAYGIVVDVKVFTPDNSDELQPGVREQVRVYIAQKRKISVGDKMAGRHGNKGVVSRILPQEDMPFLPDGTPLDIVLNPLGVPSRMNIGQVLEVNLGYVAKALGWKVQTPVFDGAHESDLRDCFADAREKWHNDNAPEYPTKLDRLMGEKGHIIDFSKIDLTDDGKTTVYDGRTGEKFPSKVTVGYMYYLKLHHLVDDKIHARSTGPYSLVTQQPLGGKAQFGGQRFGEMEVWALEAYGAAYTLQEILTVKSDDVVGRVKTYEAIVKGDPVPKPGIPESFRVLLKELQSLGLDIVVQDHDGNEVDMRQEFDDDDTGFDARDIPMGDDVLVESELQDDYSVKDADDGFDSDLDDEDQEPNAEDLANIDAMFDGE